MIELWCCVFCRRLALLGRRTVRLSGYLAGSMVPPALPPAPTPPPAPASTVTSSGIAGSGVVEDEEEVSREALSVCHQLRAARYTFLLVFFVFR